MQPERELATKLMVSNCIYYLSESNEFAMYNGGYFHKGMKVKQILGSKLSDITKTFTVIKTYKDGTEKTDPYIESMSKRSMIWEFLKGESLVSILEFDTERERICCINGHIFPLKCVDEYAGVKRVYPKGSDGLYKELKGIPLDLDEYNLYSPNGDFDSTPPGSTLFIKHCKYDESPYKTFMNLPVKYDPHATCPNIDKFLSTLVPPEELPDLFKMMAYMLMPHVDYQKGFIMYGPTRTGKSTYYTLLLRFLGINNICQLKLQTLMEDIFALANIRDKWVCMWDDLTKAKLEETDLFRIIVTNNFLEARVMYVQERVRWRNFCKLFYTTNILPEVDPEVGDEFWRRWKLFSAFHQIEKEDVDPHLIAKLTTEEELSGLLNRVLYYYRILYMEGGFEQNVEELKGLWLLDSNPIALFMERCCDIGQGYSEDYQDFHYILGKFRKENRASEVSKTKGTQCLGKLGIKKVSKKTYLGFRIKESVKAKYELESGFDPQQNMDRVFEGPSREKIEKLEKLLDRLKEIFEENGNSFLEIDSVIDALLLDGLEKSFVVEAINDLIKDRTLLEINNKIQFTKLLTK